MPTDNLDKTPVAGPSLSISPKKSSRVSATKQAISSDEVKRPIPSQLTAFESRKVTTKTTSKSSPKPKTSSKGTAKGRKVGHVSKHSDTEGNTSRVYRLKRDPKTPPPRITWAKVAWLLGAGAAILVTLQEVAENLDINVKKWKGLKPR